ncbi:hypothetical protein BKA69DRAFT_1092941 [Paraphysoderma sedebokerense]|nr:hypothetical protein BKA69DRAFT_1092941 [Paraphysoderma sedebokerense]
MPGEEATYTPTRYIFHITHHSSVPAPPAKYAHPSLKQENFIHFSPPNQVINTANRFYKKEKVEDLVVLVVDTEVIKKHGDKLQYDKVEIDFSKEKDKSKDKEGKSKDKGKDEKHKDEKVKVCAVHIS